MKNRRFIPVSILIVFFCLNQVFSYFSSFLELDKNSIEMQMLKNPQAFSLLDASLIASGVPEKDLMKYRIQLAGWRKELDGEMKSFKKRLTPEKKAEIIFDYLHKNRLKEYQDYATTLDELLNTGRYNCLSSSLLFYLLAKDYGLDAGIISLPSHVMSMVKIGKRTITIDTVSPQGFDCRDKKIPSKKTPAVLGLSSSTSPDGLSVPETLALIYINRIALAVYRKQAPEAYQNALKAWALSPAKEPVPNLVSGTQFYISYLEGQTNYRKALDVSAEVIRQFPSDRKMCADYSRVLARWLDDFLKRADYTGAIELWDKNKSVCSSEMVILEERLYSNIVAVLAGQKNDAEALKYGRKILQTRPENQTVRRILTQRFKTRWEGFLKGEDLSAVTLLGEWYQILKTPEFAASVEKMVFTVANQKAQTGDYEEALRVADRGLQICSSSENIKQFAGQVCRKASEQHGKKSDYVSAVKMGKQGLTYLPGDQSLLTNLHQAYQGGIENFVRKNQVKNARTLTQEALSLFPQDKVFLDWKERLR